MSSDRLSKLKFYGAALLVMATGAAGLMYQVVWQKYLGRLIGNDLEGVSLTLSVFLGGLALGYYVCGKATLIVRRHLLVYAVLEAVIGIWGLMFPILFAAVDAWALSWPAALPLRRPLTGLVSATVLVGPPTICMGATVPFLTRAFSPSVSEATRVHSIVYAMNTLGAVVGALLAGFVLIEAIGLPSTCRVAAVLNLTAAGVFAIAGMRRMSPVAVAESAAPSGPPRYSPPALLAVACLSGWYVAALENVFVRLTAFSLGSSSYAFSLIIAAFILAIAAGSGVVARLQHIPGALLGRTQILIAAILLVLFPSLDEWPYVAHVLRTGFQNTMLGFALYHTTVWIGISLFLILPVGLMGATIPIAFHELSRVLQRVGRDSGRLFAWNGLGAVLGSLVGGHLLFHRLDLAQVYLAAALLAAVAAIVVSLHARTRMVAGGVLAVITIGMACTLPGFDPDRFVLGTFRRHTPIPASYDGAQAFQAYISRPWTVLFRDDGPDATVAVIEGTLEADDAQSRTIVVNGKSDSNTRADAVTLKLSAHLPALWSPQAKRALIIGLGTGVTAGELTRYPGIESIDIAEISGTVIRALPYFDRFNHHLADDPRVTIHREDALSLLRMPGPSWDIIISEPSNPWMAGADALFTRDFYQLVDRRLSPHGILLQWLQTYSASRDMIKLAACTLHDVFPVIHAFEGSSGDLLLLSAREAFTHEQRKAADAQWLALPDVAASLRAVGVPGIEALLTREDTSFSLLLDNPPAQLNTLDHPRLHYLAGRDFYLDSHIKPPVGFLPSPPDFRELMR